MTKTVTVRMSPNLDREIRTEAAKLDMNRSQFLIAAAESKLKEVKRQTMQSTPAAQAA